MHEKPASSFCICWPRVWGFLNLGDSKLNFLKKRFSQSFGLFAIPGFGLFEFLKCFLMKGNGEINGRL